ncbi:unnamed protein product [Vitrella brassicaformis CCMP3155]|uniref:MACPF domain-containing protein n=1 Tax=Vitrella brassicaformis (strain CCMP3155) TaxID=1169540 RepID=A0A0G4GK70_VITBC|nr:unnamed protein product [Vitrella brassicaformis CCMP3155]|eukprot:CEM30314.1 unnamed protein product [Vitrella brassicaformis CCMP3155]
MLNILTDQTQSVEELSSLSDYRSSLSIDVSVSASYNGFLASGSFSASAGYDRFKRDIVKTSSERFDMNTYCLQFVAGLSPSMKIEPTEAMKKAIDKLPNDIKKSNLERWLDFFRIYGTHVAVQVRLGGKMSQQIIMKSKDVTKLRAEGVDVKAAMSMSYGPYSGKVKMKASQDTKSKEKLENTSKTQRTLVLGGIPPASGADSAEGFSQWAESVREAPMPVRIALAPFDEIFDAVKSKSATYQLAYEKYAEKYGAKDAGALGVAGAAPKSVKEILADYKPHKCTFDQSSYECKCPSNKKIGLGFQLQANCDDGKLDKAYYTNCPVGVNGCIGSQKDLSGDDESYTWLMCGPSEIRGVIQRFVKGENVVTATCPSGTRVSLGFKLQQNSDSPDKWIADGCTANEQSCSLGLKNQGGNDEGYVWVACFPADTPGLSGIRNVAKAGDLPSKSPSLSCPSGKKIIAGLNMQTNSKMGRVSKYFRAISAGGRKYTTYTKNEKGNDGYFAWIGCS